MSQYIQEKEIHNWAIEAENDHRQLLYVLEKVQERDRYLSEEAIRTIACEFHIQPAEVQSLATFFTSYHTHPVGTYVFKLCEGMSCDLQKKDDLREQIQEKIGIKFGETSADGLFSLETAPCLGLCDQGPVLLVNDIVFPKVSMKTLDAIIDTCRSRADAPVSLTEWSSPLLWEGRNGTTSFRPVLAGSVLATTNNRSSNSLLHDLIESRTISESLANQLDPRRRETQLNPVLVCNTDNPRPGSFGERILLCDHYDLFLEGFLTLARIAGATDGIVYLRPEFNSLKPALLSYLENLNIMSIAEKSMNDGPACSIDIRPGPGMIAGGMDRSLYSAINSDRYCTNWYSSSSYIIHVNVETAIKVGGYLAKNTSPVTQVRTTQIFSPSGNCSLPGIYELPENISIKDLLAVCGGEDAAAVQIGGIYGKFVRRSYFDEPIIAWTGSVGTSLIVYGPDTNFREVALKLLDYAIRESCGQCTPCREGPSKIREKFYNIRRDKRSKYSLADMNAISDCMRAASKCEFGQTISTGFQTLISCFPELLQTIYY
jgi:[NiFe] hydrogenase diaphorase moiety large subunit